MRRKTLDDTLVHHHSAVIAWCYILVVTCIFSYVGNLPLLGFPVRKREIYTQPNYEYS